VAIEEAPNGVDLHRFCPDSSVREKVRREFGVGDGVTVVLFVASDWDLKGLALAIDALAVARSVTGDLRLWVLGAGDERRFAAYATAAGVGEAVRFLGWRPETERYYQAADIYLCCSGYEAFSLALLEAAASGLPLVSPRVGGTTEMFDGSGDPGGVPVERRASEVGAVLAALAADADQRASYGSAARRRAERFGWDRLAKRFDAIYASLLGTLR
jgi:UDP-glucose:(heptosyl)LPS alpha-1,3-glucosyltransferase